MAWLCDLYTGFLFSLTRAENFLLKATPMVINTRPSRISARNENGISGIGSMDGTNVLESKALLNRLVVAYAPATTTFNNAGVYRLTTGMATTRQPPAVFHSTTKQGCSLEYGNFRRNARRTQPITADDLNAAMGLALSRSLPQAATAADRTPSDQSTGLRGCALHARIRDPC